MNQGDKVKAVTVKIVMGDGVSEARTRAPGGLDEFMQEHKEAIAKTGTTSSDAKPLKAPELRHQMAEKFHALPEEKQLEYKAKAKAKAELATEENAKSAAKPKTTGKLSAE